MKVVRERGARVVRRDEGGESKGAREKGGEGSERKGCEGGE